MSNESRGKGPTLAGMKFLVEEVLSTGDRDTVMRIGDQQNLGKAYALKVIKREDPADDALLERARATVEASAKLGHPAALRYHDFRVKKKYFVFTERAEVLMEFVDGQSLDALGTLEVGPGTLVFHQLAAALAHMHRRGVHHGDLKPSHVMLSRGGTLKTFGYGLNLIKPGVTARGTAQYMSPEQLKSGTIDEKTDVYSLGATVYHLLTGRPAHGGGRAVGEGGKIPTPQALNPKIVTKLNNLIVSCLQSQPDRRPEGAFELQQQLEALISEQSLDPAQLRGLARGRTA